MQTKNRRESLKAIGVAASAGILLNGYQSKQDQKKEEDINSEPGREQFEVARDHRLLSETFFTEHEMASITILVDIIIPKDEKSGSATDAKVQEFIEFIVKDEPIHQLPMRGGLRWLDVKCLNLDNNDFKSCGPQQQLEIITQIAYPAHAASAMQPGVSLFNKIRDLTAIGFSTSKMGIEDLGYKGNSPTIWKGVPAEILKQYGLESI